MTPRTKAQAYDEALERARKYMAKGYDVLMPEIFPELRESEDERIRKEIVDFINRVYERQALITTDEERDSWIAWLEKQRISEEALQNLKETHFPSEIINFQAAMNIAIAKAYDKGVKDGLVRQGELKSVWHNADEEPKRDSLILLIMQSGNPIVAKIIEPNHTFTHGERWAYIDDLLEKQGEKKTIIEMKSPEESLGISSEEYNDIIKMILLMSDIINECIYGESKPSDKVEPKEYTFKSLPRLLDMIEPSDRATAYCQKLIGALVREGYTTDAKIVGECLKQMNGEKVAMAVMDEKQCGTDNCPLECSTNTVMTDSKKNKVESKFKVGDWVVNNITKDVFLIKSINNGYCTLEDIKGNIISPCLPPLESESHLWSIEDAKDGDVLATSWPGAFIYNGKRGGLGCPGSYCGINTLGRFQTGSETHWTTREAYPATKEQRDLLFQKMKEAGYEWNAEKKELRKFPTPADVGFAELGKAWEEEAKGKKPAWSEEDDVRLQACLDTLQAKSLMGVVDTEMTKWLKSLKQRIGG